VKTQYLALLSLLALLLAACGTSPLGTEAVPGTPAQPTPEVSPGIPARPTPGESPLPEPEVRPVSPLPIPPAAPLDAAVAYLAAELNVSPEEVTVLSFEPVEWSDASLGCPQPGMMYAQVITPGYLFLLEAGGRRHEVHTDRTGQNVVICERETSGDLRDPEAAFRVLLAHLIQTTPGFGLDQQGEWIQDDITSSGLVGASTRAWRSGEWTLEMSFPVLPQPVYEIVLAHQRAGLVWTGTLEAAGTVTPADEPLLLSFDVGSCDETVPPDSLNEWAGVEFSVDTSVDTVQEGAIHIEQNLSYVCCAELALTAGREGEVIKVIETNVGEVCRCMCGYPLTADLTGLSPGTYTVEVWGVQHFDVHPLELLGSGEVTIP